MVPHKGGGNCHPVRLWGSLPGFYAFGVINLQGDGKTAYGAPCEHFGRVLFDVSGFFQPFDCLPHVGAIHTHPLAELQHFDGLWWPQRHVAQKPLVQP